MSRFDASLLSRAYQATKDALGVPTVQPRASAATVVEIAAELCARFEGLRLRPYLCPASVPSIGYGATHYRDGTRVKLTDPEITAEEAFSLLLWQLENVYLPAVYRACPSIRLQSAKRIAAILDWTFNLGEGRLKASTLRRRINSNEWGDVPAEIRKWVMAAGKPLRGLIIRRDTEASMI